VTLPRFAVALDRLDDRGVARPQHGTPAGARQHRGERGAERARSDDADGICARHEASGGMCAVRF